MINPLAFAYCIKVPTSLMRDIVHIPLAELKCLTYIAVEEHRASRRSRFRAPENAEKARLHAFTGTMYRKYLVTKEPEISDSMLWPLIAAC